MTPAGVKNGANNGAVAHAKSPSDWGSVRDGRSKIGKLARQIRLELEREYVTKSSAQRRALAMSARTMAEVERLTYYPETAGQTIRISQLAALSRRILAKHPRKAVRQR